MMTCRAGLLAVCCLLIVAPLTEGQNFRSRFVPRPRPRPAPGRRPVNVNPNRIPVPSGTVFQGRPFRPFPGQPTTTTTTTTTTPTTTTSATTTTTSLPRPPPALANDAPVPNPQDTGKKADIVPRKLLNIGTGTGNRPTTQAPISTANSTRPSTLEKTGGLRPKITQDSGDTGNDAPPTSNTDDRLLEDLYKDEALKYVQPRNIRNQGQPGPPQGVNLLGRSQNTGSNDAGTTQVDSQGFEFWVAFLDNRVELPVNQPLEIYVAAGHYPTGVKATVKMWYYSPYGRQEEVFDTTEINSDSVKVLTVPAYMRNVVNGIFKKGIRIVSDQPVSVVGFNYERFSADAFRVIPLDALSTHYIAVTFGQPRIRTQLACLALRDDTLIQVTLPDLPPIGLTEPVVDIEGVRFNAGESFNVTMNAFEVIALRSVGDLTGANILANDKIACFSGNVRAHVAVGVEGWSRDHLISQLLPVSTWENEFVIAPAPSGLAGASLGEKHIFVSSEANTTIVITQGSAVPVSIFIQAARGKATISNLDTFAHVISDKPIQIAQVFGSQQGRDSAVTGDPSMIIYSGIRQFSNIPQTTLPPMGHFGYINKVLIIIDRDERDGLRMSRKRNRNLENNGWISIPNTNLVGRYLNVDEDRLTQIYHIDTRVRFYVQYYGFSDRESYTYGGAITMNLGCDHTPSLPGDGIDNDCDGFVDEEIIDRYDNDNDGLLDEDIGHRQPYELVGGKEYVLTFMENAAEQFGQQIHLYVAVAPDVSATNVDVTFSQPLLTGGIPRTTLTITKGQFHMVNLDPSNAVIYGTTRSNQAIKVEASERVVIYALNKKIFSMDGNLLFSNDRLGTEYYTVSYSPSHVATQFAIVATEPGTVVDIVFPPEVVGTAWADGPIQVPWEGRMWTNNHALRINLAQYEALQMQSGYDLPTDYLNRYLRGDLTGTKISSNKPIAVFSGNGRVNTKPSRSRDHLVEQMPPVTSWGKEYIVTPTPGRTVGEYYRIIASEPNTNVIVDRSDGVYETFVLGQGEFNQINIQTGGVSGSIYADKPIMVVMFMKSQDGAQTAMTEPGDPAMIVIPHTHQWMYDIHFGTPLAEYQEFYVTVVLQRKYKDGLKLNGVLVPSADFIITPRLGTKTYAYVILNVQQGNNYELTHTDPTASFFAQLYGTRDRESVGYILGVNLPIENQAYVYYPVNPPIPGGFSNDPFDIYTVELCGDGIDNDGDFLADEDCEHAHEYYAMFMTNSVPQPLDHSLEIHCVSTSNQNYVRLTTGRINRRIARHEVEKNIIQETILNRDESILFTVPGHYRAQLSRSGYFDTQFKGVVVESDWGLECFAFNKDTGSADGWLMKDYYDLGTRHVVSAAYPYANRQLVGMVAPDDDTMVSITLPVVTDPNLYYSYVDVQGYRYYGGETFNITLDRLQIFQLDVMNGFDLTGTFINSNRPIAVFSGNERSGIPYEFGVGWDHAADQIPSIVNSLDLDPVLGTAYRYDVMPTAGSTFFDRFQCIGWASGTTVNIRQNGTSMQTTPLQFMGSLEADLPSTGGPVQIFSNNPLMCEQFAWSDPNRVGSSPELAANILANTFYDSRPWFRFVVPKVSTLASFYEAFLVVSFNLDQIFQDESPAFFLDGDWVSDVDSFSVVGDQAWFTISGLGYGPHAISSAIVDNADNTVKVALLRFTIQVFLNSGFESIAYSPVPEQLYTL